MGEPIVIKLCSRDPEPPPFEYVKGGGGIFKDMAIHDLDMARLLMNPRNPYPNPDPNPDPNPSPLALALILTSTPTPTPTRTRTRTRIRAPTHNQVISTSGLRSSALELFCFGPVVETGGTPRHAALSPYPLSPPPLSLPHLAARPLHA